MMNKVACSSQQSKWCECEIRHKWTCTDIAAQNASVLQNLTWNLRIIRIIIIIIITIIKNNNNKICIAP